MDIKTFFLCFFCSLVHIPSFILRFIPFKNIITPKKKKILLRIYSFSTIFNAIFYYIVYSYGEITIGFYKLNLIIFCTIMAIVNAVVIKGYNKEHLFTFGITAIIINIILSITSYFQKLISNNDIVIDITINAAICCIVFAVFSPLLIRLLTKTVTPFLNTNNDNYWKNLCWVPVTMCFASVFSWPIGEQISTFMQLISKILVAIATVFICKCISSDYLLFQKKETMKNSIQRQKEYYEVLSEKVQDARKVKHDLKHHINAILYYLDTKNYDDIRSYCIELSNRTLGNNTIPYTGNGAIDGILYHYYLMCKKENINFNYVGSIKDGSISDIDLCIIIGNIVDNAYIACKNYKGNKKFISLSMKKSDKLITIAIQNSFDGIVQKTKKGFLSRKRKNELGIGLESVKSICKNNNGEMKIEYQDNIFSVMILINII